MSEYVLSAAKGSKRAMSALFDLNKNGVFDEKIANIVKEKQSSYGLVPNGVVDYTTFQLLLKEYRSRKTINEADSILFGISWIKRTFRKAEFYCIFL